MPVAPQKRLNPRMQYFAGGTVPAPIFRQVIGWPVTPPVLWWMYRPRGPGGQTMTTSKRRGEVIRTQIVTPLESAGVIDRPRLRELLNNIESTRLTVVQAPAGYGKTTPL